MNDKPAVIDPKDIAIETWNSEAYGYNQWNALGQNEKDDLIAIAKRMEKLKAEARRVTANELH